MKTTTPASEDRGERILELLREIDEALDELRERNADRIVDQTP